LQVLYLMLQLYGLSLTRLELLISLVQLGLEVVDVALGGGQLVLSVLQSGAGIIKEDSLEVMVAISPHQLLAMISTFMPRDSSWLSFMR
jgi:2-polyprenyl-3-methyl-5-hydroxy-6-metoxy-1,4-benzoquinol methylase